MNTKHTVNRAKQLFAALAVAFFVLSPSLAVFNAPSDTPGTALPGIRTNPREIDTTGIKGG